MCSHSLTKINNIIYIIYFPLYIIFLFLFAVCSVHSSERLEKEKEELRVSLEDALQELQEQHQKDMAELERRLQAFYQVEWDKVHLTYQEEAEKCKSLMQQQVCPYTNLYLPPRILINKHFY